MSRPQIKAGRRHSSVESCYASLERGRRDLAHTRAHLRHTCGRVCAKPSTLAAAFVAGGLIGLASTRVEPSRQPAASGGGDSTRPPRRVFTTLGALGLHLTSRYLLGRVGAAALSSVSGRGDGGGSGEGG